MKQEYEKTVLIITRFSQEDVIITSSDTNNAYTDLSDLNNKEARMLPNR